MSSDLDEQVLTRFVAAFENADVAGLSELLRLDVELEMPPVPTWFTGHDAVLRFFAERVMTGARRRFVHTRANGCPAAATYAFGEDGRLHAHSIIVLETAGGRIGRMYAFLDPALFPAFGLPDVWDGR